MKKNHVFLNFLSIIFHKAYKNENNGNNGNHIKCEGLVLYSTITKIKYTLQSVND